MAMPHWQRNVEEQIQRDRRADDFGQIAGGDRQLADHPEKPDDRRRIVVAARLREIAAGDDAELRCQPLQQDRHQVRHQDDAEQRVAELRSAGEIGGPVARIHVADGHQVSGPGECEELPPPRSARQRDRLVDLGQRWSDAGASPSGVRYWQFSGDRSWFSGGH